MASATIWALAAGPRLALNKPARRPRRPGSAPGGAVFPKLVLPGRGRHQGGQGGGAPAPEPPATAHGFRSSFKVWAAEAKVPDEVSEAALAHADKDRVRAAYLRTAFLEERRALMQAWADYLQGTLA